MRHGFRNRKLGRTTSHRLALFRNQLASLVDRERIVTTLPKAKELRPLAERVITQSRRGTLHARRLAQRWIGDRQLLKKLFDEIGPRMKARPGGYLRIVKLGPRLGDGAEMAVLEFVDFEFTKPAPAAEEKKAKAKKPAEGEAPEAEAATEEKAAKKPAAKAGGKKKAAKPPGPEAKAHAKERKAPKADVHGKGAKTRGPRKAGGE